MGFYQLLHSMGVFGPAAPATIRAFGTQGQLSPAQLIDRYGIVCRPVRDVLVAYLQERQPAVDHTTLHNLALSLGGLFWRDLERHHPGIDSLHLQPAVAAAWKQRLLTKTRRVTGPNGQMSEVREPRAAGLHSMGAVRAFYLDIAQWAMEDPSRWAPWAAPCPIRAGGPGAAEDAPRPQVTHGPTHPGTAARAARPGRPPARRADRQRRPVCTPPQATAPGATFTVGRRQPPPGQAPSRMRTVRVWAENPGPGPTTVNAAT